MINQRPFAKMADGRESRSFSPKNLYVLCVSAVAGKFQSYKPHLADLPKNVRFDLYYQVNVKLSSRRQRPSLGQALLVACATVVFVFVFRFAKTTLCSRVDAHLCVARSFALSRRADPRCL